MDDEQKPKNIPPLPPPDKGRRVGFRTGGFEFPGSPVVDEQRDGEQQVGAGGGRLRSAEEPTLGFYKPKAQAPDKQELGPGDTLQNWALLGAEFTDNNDLVLNELNAFEEIVMIDNIQSVLNDLSATSGFIAAALVDANSGMVMGSVSSREGFDVEVAAATNTDVVRAKLRAMEALGLNAAIEDILITLDNQYHLIRPLATESSLFLYLAVNRDKANLALCRRAMALTEDKLEI